MKNKKCIYCDKKLEKGVNVSESDIMPDALTNDRILNDNVCKIEHNNRFSDLFENKVINDFAYITNQLDIKSSKAKKYIGYDTEIKINDETYLAKLHSNADLFKNVILKSVDGSHIISPQNPDEIKAKGRRVDSYDVNDKEVIKKVSIPVDIFYSKEIYRLMSKIAFEWYCLENEIDFYCEEFLPIVQFITTGSGANPVQLVADEKIYESLGLLFPHDGSHRMMTYNDTDGKIFVLIYFFGITLYKVMLLNKPLLCAKYNFLYKELSVDGNSNPTIKYNSIEDVAKKSNDMFANIVEQSNLMPPIQSSNIYGVQIDGYHADKSYQFFLEIANLLVFYDLIKKSSDNNPSVFLQNDFSKHEQNKLCEILLPGLRKTFSSAIITKRKLKRFVSEYLPKSDISRINFESIHPQFTFLIYLVIQVGLMNLLEFDSNKIHDMIKKKLKKDAEGLFLVDRELEVVLNKEIKAYINIYELIENGCNIIRAWS